MKKAVLERTNYVQANQFTLPRRYDDFRVVGKALTHSLTHSLTYSRTHSLRAPTGSSVLRLTRWRENVWLLKRLHR